jgi:hypothetical protein
MQGLLLYYPIDAPTCVSRASIQAKIVHAAHDWQQHFLQKAQAFYDTYLAWLYVHPAPDAVSGCRVLEALLARGTGDDVSAEYSKRCSRGARVSDARKNSNRMLAWLPMTRKSLFSR